MRAPVPSSSWLKRTSLGETALNSFTGTLTSPKLMDPLQMALGISLCSHSCCRHFPHDFPRLHVSALALVGRMAQDAHVRPLGELHLDHDLGLDPDGFLRRRSWRRWVERCRVAPERIEEAEQPRELGVGEPGADPPGEAEVAITL